MLNMIWLSLDQNDLVVFGAHSSEKPRSSHWQTIHHQVLSSPNSLPFQGNQSVSTLEYQHTIGLAIWYFTSATSVRMKDHTQRRRSVPLQIIELTCGKRILIFGYLFLSASIPTTFENLLFTQILWSTFLKWNIDIPKAQWIWSDVDYCKEIN